MYLNDTYAGKIYTTIESFMNKATKDTKKSTPKIANRSYKFTNALTGVINK